MTFGRNKTAGGENPLDIDQAKEHLRIDGPDFDADLAAKLTEALAWCEEQTGRQFVTATWDLTFHQFPMGGRPQLLPFGHLDRVDQIVYVAPDGTSTTINSAAIATDYVVDTSREPGRIAPVFGNNWPETRRQSNAVVYTIQCGQPAASIDANAMALLKIATAHLWWDRDLDEPSQRMQQLVNNLRFDDLVRYDPERAPKA